MLVASKGPPSPGGLEKKRIPFTRTRADERKFLRAERGGVPRPSGRGADRYPEGGPVVRGAGAHVPDPMPGVPHPSV